MLRRVILRLNGFAQPVTDLSSIEEDPVLLVGSPAGRDVLAKLDCSVWLAAKPQCGTERGTQTPLSASSWEAVQNSGTELSKPSQEAHREVEPFVFAR